MNFLMVRFQIYVKFLHLLVSFAFLKGNESNARQALEYSSEEEDLGDEESTEDEDADYDDDDEVEDEDGEDEEEDEESYLANEQFCANMIEEPGKDSGCTAVIALLHGRDLYVANAGDSRCVVCRNGKAIEMSLDHKPEDDEECARIVKAGGRVTLDGRVNGGLNLSRALGDHAYKMVSSLSLFSSLIISFEAPTIKSVLNNRYPKINISIAKFFIVVSFIISRLSTYPLRSK